MYEIRTRCQTGEDPRDWLIATTKQSKMEAVEKAREIAKALDSRLYVVVIRTPSMVEVARFQGGSECPA